ncbi:hypothetical protein [Rhizobium sp. S163]|uniref:hypothetical protein n=1 Tax=Rhizobium sp. S163 TaxID=3055039 RepID=UPI0025A9B6FE|nr:hypothetical protein [Rhizobium sp. S163]MDM9647136.1 hypothetical protein [Rhizobium sp. S163]
MLKRIDDCRIRWLIRTKQACGLQAEHDVFLTLTAINFGHAAFCFVNDVVSGLREQGAHCQHCARCLDENVGMAYIQGVEGRFAPAFHLLRL